MHFYRYNAKYLQFVETAPIFFIFLITTVKITMECETQKS